ncbi:hypothetical protein NQZ68_017697 [Dissostichus eleginoides]|nr:hypothetical protein NQZ68_017697 [Dissostichus eleginoides]
MLTNTDLLTHSINPLSDRQHLHGDNCSSPPKLTLGRREIPEEEPQHEEKREVASQPAALLHIQPPPHQQQLCCRLSEIGQHAAGVSCHSRERSTGGERQRETERDRDLGREKGEVAGVGPHSTASERRLRGGREREHEEERGRRKERGRQVREVEKREGKVWDGGGREKKGERYLEEVKTD